MQKINDEKIEKSTAKNKMGDLIRMEIEKRRTSPLAFVVDILVFLCALIFARASVVFGARPFALAFVAVLPTHTWIALLGAVVGSLSLGVSGVIFAMICAITVFLRVIISGGDSKSTVSDISKASISFVGDENDGQTRESAHKKQKLFDWLGLSMLSYSQNTNRLFCENLLLRMSSAVIGGFICAVYEILLSGFELKSVLFGIGMIILPAVLSLAFAGLFESGVSFKEVLGDGKAVFATAAAEKKNSLIFFRISALIFVFCLSLSLGEYSVFGISAPYVFSTIITLFVAKRFGAISGGAIGFAATIGVSSVYSLGFTLLGLISGALFGINHLYAFVGGGALLLAFSAYSGGVVGISTTLPEYIIGALISYPITRLMPTERKNEEIVSSEKTATDMVGTMALFYKSAARKTLSKLPSALCEISKQIEVFTGVNPKITQYEDIVHSVIKEYAPTNEKDENNHKIATKVYKNEELNADDFQNFDFTYDEINEIIDKIEKAVFSLPRLADRCAEEIKLLSLVINDTTFTEENELLMDEDLTDKLEGVIKEHGLSDGVIRAFGNRNKHLILAGRDDDGTLITSPALKRDLEGACGIALGSYEYFRKGKMALLECDAAPKYKVEYAFATAPGSDGEASGDRTASFTTANGLFYSLVFDGMGSGEIAGEAADFSAGILTTLLNMQCSAETGFHTLNTLLRHGREECSVSVDLFEFDLIHKEAVFIKSGAAPSYVKRGSSIFRVRSSTAPLGLMSVIDSEKIKVQVEAGDYVIMISDGISQNPEDAPWLLELLSSRSQRTPKEYAELILKEAKSRVHRYDDMTVAVMKITT